MPIVRRYPLTTLRLRRLGIDRDEVELQMQAMEAEGLLPEKAEDIDVTDALQLIDRLKSTRQDAYCEAHKAGADWQAFVQAVVQIMQMIMPLIVKKRAPQPA
jgi:predicted RNA-binding protein Jag